MGLSVGSWPFNKGDSDLTDVVDFAFGDGAEGSDGSRASLEEANVAECVLLQLT